MSILSPEQLLDLKASGLNDATIAALGVVAVRPHDLPVKAAQSAYRIPYFDLNGAINGFHRLKFVPPVHTSKGLLKYYQTPGSSPHLYLPPLLAWRAVAINSKVRLTITEGEKKAASACQHGLITAGVSGTWCWRSTLDNGDRLTLQVLDEFLWPNRSVLICPDSDAWTEDNKGFQILSGFLPWARSYDSVGPMSGS